MNRLCMEKYVSGFFLCKMHKVTSGYLCIWGKSQQNKSKILRFYRCIIKRIKEKNEVFKIK